ncbi:MAG: oxidoreductase [Actinomycetota bacterium]|nr:oxidoreductase [Actinomycetota bacterium]
MSKWTAADMVDQTGRHVIITGANSGLGAACARELARAGASVLLACRNVAKGESAAAQMSGDVEVRQLDLADLSSVRAFADGVETVDVLVNNAGVMAVPQARTADGFEMQIGTNHLGHFALTGLLLPKLTDRVVTLSSGVHRVGRIDLNDLNWERRRYRAWAAYGQSKLANLMFAFELQRRLAAAGSAVRSLAAHPGYAATELQSHTESVLDRVMVIGNRLIAQPADRGALPALYAAAVADIAGGSFVGPDGLGELTGHPRLVGSSKASRDEAVAARLWTLSERLTAVTYL